jgi:hypothetical protein
MSRASWINDASHPEIDAHVEKLDHFTKSLADGVVDDKELAIQEKNLVVAMKSVESTLNDDQHAKVTALLAELAAYSVMRTLHDVAQIPRGTKTLKL